MKNKKSIAMAMAAVSSFGAVAPAFANEVTVAPIADKEVNVALAEGNKVDVMNYGQVYDTKFTADKKDDTVKEGLTILDVISDEEGKESYLVSRAYTIEDIRTTDDNRTDKELEAELAKMIAIEKNNLEDTISDIKHKLTLSFINEKGEKKALYTIDKKKSGEVQAEDTKTKTGNYYKLVLVNNQATENKETEIIFNNIKVEEKTEEEKVEPKIAKVDLYDEAFSKGYATLSKYAFELSVAKNITVETKEVNPTTLEVKVFKNDGKKTHVATLTIAGMDLFDADKFIKIATTGDFVGHWAQDQIVDAMIAGQVDVAENFRPQDGITRAEFAKIACTVFDIEVNNTNAEPFHDVNNGDWYQKYVAALYNKKVGGQSVVQGDGENFRPNDKITRQEVAVIVSKLTSGEVQESTTPVNGTKVENIVKTKFKDTKSIAAWADESVKYLNETAKYTNAKGEEKAIVEGDNGYFNPTQAITRAEALVMVQRAASATTIK